MPAPEIRKEMPSVQLTREQFSERMRQQLKDPAFDTIQDEVEKVISAAWQGYSEYRKSPRTQPAGPGYADPNYQLSSDWIQASRRVKDAERRQKNPTAPPRVLLISSAARSEHTCPG